MRLDAVLLAGAIGDASTHQPWLFPVRLCTVAVLMHQARLWSVGLLVVCGIVACLAQCEAVRHGSPPQPTATSHVANEGDVVLHPPHQHETQFSLHTVDQGPAELAACPASMCSNVNGSFDTLCVVNTSLIVPVRAAATKNLARVCRKLVCFACDSSRLVRGGNPTLVHAGWVRCGRPRQLGAGRCCVHAVHHKHVPVHLPAGWKLHPQQRLLRTSS